VLILFYYILLIFEHNVISFVFFSIITARINVIPLETAREEYEVQVLDERIESGGYGPFKYTVTISNE
jgi:hypothetical protein